MVWNLNVQLEVDIAIRCSTNMLKEACALVVRKRGKRNKKGPIQVSISTPMWAISLSIIVNYLPTNSQVAWWFVDNNVRD
jgi:hypothetical protein